jgi:hypothetical protein
MKLKIYLIVVAGLLLLGLAIVACGATSEPCPTTQPCPTAVAAATAAPCPACPAAEACPTAEACPECPAATECPTSAVEVPFEALWAASGHADKTAEAFNHWNEDDPKEVPTSCANCHSSPGFLDYIGADGSQLFVVDQPAPIGTVITCVTCHNEAADKLAMEPIPFPSGITLTVGGPTARCAVCHQGRSSTQGVNAAIAQSGVETDTVSADLRFTNIHYFAAAATLYGNEVQGGYQYEGKVYDGKFGHVEELNTCIDCHDQHSLQVQVDTCKTCHTDVATVDDLKNIRMQGSLADYDGDGDEKEGIYYELQGLQEKLLQAIQGYATEVAGTAIAYDAASYPYFFADANGNGAVDEGEAGFASWTPRLLKAAYNYQTSIKDPGTFAHNAKYIIQLVYDSTEDLNTKLSTPVDLSTAHREDPGHFMGTSEAFRHWDAEGEVPGTCSKCHSGYGLPFFLKEGVAVSQEPTNGLMCTTCHDSVTEFTRYQVEQVTFPSGATVAYENLDANLCLNCHQGRESTVSINAAIATAGVDDNTVSDALSFRNPHYFAAGATVFGSEAQGAYQYEGKEYVGRFLHVAGFNTCVNCHSTHALTVQVQACSACHTGVTTEEDLVTIRMSSVDYDGDGDTQEGMGEEVAGVAEKLYAAIQAYASGTVGTPIAFNGQSYPYWFTDTGERYVTWTPRLLRAAYNYTWQAKDPGTFAHNGKYMIQVMYDSMQDIGGDVSSMTRP